MQVSFGGRRGSTSDRLKPAPVYSHPVTFHYEIQNHTTRMQKITKAFEVYRLMALTLVCVIAGIIIGLICRPYAHNWSERKFMYIELPGELYLRFLKLMIIPLLVSNVILSFGSIQGKISSRLGKVACFLYLSSNLIAISLAIVIAMIISPGGPTKSVDGGRLYSSSLINSYNNIASHHYFNEYHDSIERYREYHPMYYHTNLDASPDQRQPKKVMRLTIIDTSRTMPAATGSQGAGKSVEGDIRMVGKNRVRQEAVSSSLPPPPLLLQTSSGQLMTIDIKQNDINMSSAHFDEEVARLVSSVEQKQDRESITAPIIGMNRKGLSTKLPIDVILDVMRNLIPDSLVGAALQQSRTRLFTPRDLKIDRNGTVDPSPHAWQMGHEVVNQPNVVGLLAISVLTGVVLSHMGEASRPLLDLCSCISELSLRVGMKAIHIAPVALMFLLIGQISRATNLSLIAGELCMYVVTVILAMFIHGFVLLPVIYHSITKKSPLKFLNGLIQALVASFATSSSSATMALMLNCLSELNINPIIVRAFGPLGSVFNMNGTSIFEAVAVIFIAQTLGVRLPIASLLLIGLCSAIASLSTSGIPSSGMMTMVIVLNAINLPVLELSLIYIVDFIIDRFRTVVNVWSGAIVCGLIDHICPEELFEEEMKPEKYQEMIKYRNSRSSLTSRKLSQAEEKPQVISVTITPPPVESSNI